MRGHCALPQGDALRDRRRLCPAARRGFGARGRYDDGAGGPDSDRAERGQAADRQGQTRAQDRREAPRAGHRPLPGTQGPDRQTARAAAGRRGLLPHGRVGAGDVPQAAARPERLRERDEDPTNAADGQIQRAQGRDGGLRQGRAPEGTALGRPRDDPGRSPLFGVLGGDLRAADTRRAVRRSTAHLPGKSGAGGRTLRA